MSLTKPKINQILAAYHEYADRKANECSIAYLCHFLGDDCPCPNLIGQPLTDHLLAAIARDTGHYKVILWSDEDWYCGVPSSRLRSTLRADYLHFLLLDFATNGPFPQTPSN